MVIERGGHVVVHIIAGLGDGGAEGVLYRLCKSSDTYKHTVISLTDAGKYGPLLNDVGIPVYCLGMRRGPAAFVDIYRLWRLLHEKKPSLVQTWMYHADLFGGLAARAAGVRTVFWGVRNSTLEAGSSARSTIFIARACASLSRVLPHRILCCAYSAARVHSSLGYDARKIDVIPNGYDVEQFRPDPQARSRVRSKLGIDESVPLIGMVGRFDPQKDHGNFIRSLGLLKERGYSFCCILVGRDVTTDNAALAECLNAAGVVDDVKLLGQCSDVASIMNAVDLHVLASAFGEAFPNVVAEAMACGTPCVSTNVGDASFIIGNTGWVVEPCRATDLADAIALALEEKCSSESNWEARRSNCRKRIVDNFSIESMVCAFESAWR